MHLEMESCPRDFWKLTHECSNLEEHPRMKFAAFLLPYCEESVLLAVQKRQQIVEQYYCDVRIWIWTRKQCCEAEET